MTTGDSSWTVSPRTVGTSTGSENALTILTATPNEVIVVPHGAFLLNANFVRQGADLGHGAHILAASSMPSARFQDLSVGNAVLGL